MNHGFCNTYRMNLPVLASDNIKLAADTILVVEGATLDVARGHQVEGRVRRLQGVINFHIVAANAHLI